MPTRYEILDGIAKFNPAMIEHVTRLLPPYNGPHKQRIYDFFAGDGETVGALADAWNIHAFGTEKHGALAEDLMERFGVHRGVYATNRAVSVTAKSAGAVWHYPPMGDSNESLTNDTQNVIQILQNGGLLLLVGYRHRMQEELWRMLWRVCDRIDIYRVEKHEHQWEQLLVVARRGSHDGNVYNFEGNMRELIISKWWDEHNPVVMKAEKDPDFAPPKIRDHETGEMIDDPNWEHPTYPTYEMKFPQTDVSEKKIGWAGLAKIYTEYLEAVQWEDIPGTWTIPEEPQFSWPAPVWLSSRALGVTFVPTRPTAMYRLALLKEDGPHNSPRIASMVAPMVNDTPLQPILPGRDRQVGSIVASGAMGDAVRIVNEQGDPMLIRTRITREDVLIAEEAFYNPDDGELDKTVTKYQNRPKTTITAMSADELLQLSDDQDLADFITQNADQLMDYMRENFPALYNMADDEFWPIAQQYLEDIRVRGDDDSPLKREQKHLVAGVSKAFRTRKGLIIVGEMGVGKTAMAASILHVMREEAKACGYSKKAFRRKGGAMLMPGEIVMALVPPMVNNWDKWIGEITLSIPNSEVRELRSYEDIDDIKALSDRCAAAGKRIRRGEARDGDAELASKLIVGVISESMAKQNTDVELAYETRYSANYSQLINDRMTRGDLNWDALKPMAFNPLTGHELTYSSNQEVHNLVERDEPGKRKRRLFARGSKTHSSMGRDVKGEKFQGDLSIIEDAIRQDDEGRRRFSDWLEENGGDLSEIDDALIPWEMLYPHSSNRRINEDTWMTARWNNLEAAMAKNRMARQRYEGNNQQATPIYQQRNEDNINALVGFDLRKGLRRRWVHERGYETHFNYERIHVDAEAWEARQRIMPFPDLCARLLDDDSYLVGRHPDYKRKSPISLAEYAKRVLAGRVGLFMADEIHQYKDFSAQRGRVMTILANLARKGLGLTGTAFGGKASTIFTLLYIWSEEVRRMYPDINDAVVQRRWFEDMGVWEQQITTKHRDANGNMLDNPTTRKGSKTEAPGISPLLLKLVVNAFVFFSLYDLGEELPPLANLAVPIPMDRQELGIHVAMDSIMDGYLEGLGRKRQIEFLSEWMAVKLGHPNEWWRDRKVWHRMRVSTNVAEMWMHEYDGDESHWHIDPERDETSNGTVIRKLVTTIPGFGDGYLSSKERWLQRLVANETAQGRGVAVFLAQTDRHDLSERFTNNEGTGILDGMLNVNPIILRSNTTSTQGRSAWIREKAAQGNNVLICNARLVEVGMDLLDFPTIVFYEPHYSLYTMAQASRRAYRLNQTRECSVYYPYYVKTNIPEHMHRFAPTLEQRAVELVARKEAAAAFLRGESAALSDLAEGSTNIQTELINAIAGDAQQSIFADPSEIMRDAATLLRTWDPPTYMEGYESDYDPTQPLARLEINETLLEGGVEIVDGAEGLDDIAIPMSEMGLDAIASFIEGSGIFEDADGYWAIPEPAERIADAETHYRGYIRQSIGYDDELNEVFEWVNGNGWSFSDEEIASYRHMDTTASIILNFIEPHHQYNRVMIEEFGLYSLDEDSDQPALVGWDRSEHVDHTAGHDILTIDAAQAEQIVQFVADGGTLDQVFPTEQEANDGFNDYLAATYQYLSRCAINVGEVDETLARRHYDAGSDAHEAARGCYSQIITRMVQDHQLHWRSAYLSELEGWMDDGLSLRAIADLLARRGEADQREAERVRFYEEVRQLLDRCGESVRDWEIGNIVDGSRDEYEVARILYGLMIEEYLAGEETNYITRDEEAEVTQFFVEDYHSASYAAALLIEARERDAQEDEEEYEEEEPVAVTRRDVFDLVEEVLNSNEDPYEELNTREYEETVSRSVVDDDLVDDLLDSDQYMYEQQDLAAMAEDDDDVEEITISEYEARQADDAAAEDAAREAWMDELANILEQMGHTPSDFPLEWALDAFAEGLNPTMAAFNGIQRLREAQQVQPETVVVEPVASENVFYPSFDWNALWHGFIDSLRTDQRGLVVRALSKYQNYGSLRLKRRDFVQRSASAFVGPRYNSNQAGDSTYAIGEFECTATEYAYLIYIYNTTGIREAAMEGKTIHHEYIGVEVETHEELLRIQG